MDNYAISSECAVFSFSDITIPLRISTRWSVKTHGHFSYEIHFIVKGSAIVCFQNDETARLQAGDCIIIAPNVFHYINDAEDIEKISLRFNVEKKNSCGDKEFNRYAKVLGAIKDYAVEQFDEHILGQIISVTREKYLSDFFTRKAFGLNLLSLIITTLGKTQDASGIDNPDKPDKTSASELQETRKIQIEMWYENNLDSPSVESLANTLCLGVKQTERVVKRVTGKTFKRYLYEFRMKRAAYLLSVEKKDTAQVAEETGYSSTGVFRHAFGSFYGVSPDDYESV